MNEAFELVVGLLIHVAGSALVFAWAARRVE